MSERMRVKLSQMVGYRIHTNNELGFMLRGEKPLAAFSDYEGHFPQVVVRYLRMFDRHVEAGRFIRRKYRAADEIAGKPATLLRIFYALPSEEWRIKALHDLRNQGRPWSEDDERREGQLLGYTEEQCDIWMKSYRNSHQQS
jgi:hypothetical protein